MIDGYVKHLILGVFCHYVLKDYHFRHERLGNNLIQNLLVNVE